MATETTITAGTVDEYINKLSKLGKPVLQARIAKLKAKLKHFAGIAKSGKYAAAGKPGPKNKQHLAGAVRYCQGALSWHESALQKVGTATAAARKIDAHIPDPTEFGFTREGFTHELTAALHDKDKHTKKILDHLYNAVYAKDKVLNRLLLDSARAHNRDEELQNQ